MVAEVNDVVSNLVSKVEEASIQNLVHEKKRYKRYKTAESRQQRDIENHPLLPGCPSTCPKKCSENFTEDVRAKINQYYWGLSKQMQIQWISHLVEVSDTSRPRKHTTGKKERLCTRTYFLENLDRKNIQVCQVMFLRTLGMKSDRIMRTALSKTADTRITVAVDLRGKHEPPNKKSEAIVKRVESHIRKYNPCVSHYRRAHAPNRLYISPEHSIRSMYKDYCNTYPNDSVSYNYYRKVVKNLNISFVKLGEEECEICELHTSHLSEEHKLSESEHNTQSENGKTTKKVFPDCATCDRFQKHIQTAKEARSSYQDEKKKVLSSNEIVVSVDMQKVIMLPRLPGIKQAIFCKRLVLFNETFAPIGKVKEMKPTGVLWHEAIKGRSAEDVASTFILFVRNFRDCERFVFWADNCSGQNKNWFLYTAFVNEVNRNNGTVKEIVVKYFEPGHTFMSADSFHHLVEQNMRKQRRVEDFQDFVNLVDSCGKSLVMEYNNFFKFPRGVSQAKYASKKPKLEDVQVVMFKRGSDEMFWKTTHAQKDFQSSQFLQKKYIKSLGNDFECAEQARGVSTAKKENIVSTLCPFLQPSRRDFWENLPINDDSVDLLTDRDQSEYFDNIIKA